MEHYDENNAFNIFTNNLKLRKKNSKSEHIDSNKPVSEGNEPKENVGLSKE